MKIKYLFHPREYAVAENECFYAAQASKGWFLEKRGSHLSRFRKGEPKNLRYRMEFSAPKFMEEPGLPTDQIELYEECGWQLAASAGILHVFFTPENSGASELYTTPEQQADALKGLRRSYRGGGWFIILFAALLIATMFYNRDGWVKLTVKFVRETPWLMACALFLISNSVDILVGWIQTAALCRRLKKGLRIDRRPKKRHIACRLVIRATRIAALISVLLLLVQFCTIKNWTWEERREGPYLTLAEIGIEGEHGDSIFGEESQVERMYSLTAEMWDTREVVTKQENGNSVILYQDVFRMINEKWAKRLVPGLLKEASLAKKFDEVSVDGLDEAWVAANECIAMKGNVVWYITIIDFGAQKEDIMPLLEAVAKK